MKYLCILISILPLASYAQTFQPERASIPVKVGDHQLQFPWNGGYNTLGIGMTDIDNDGDFDLLLTGRDESRLVFYRNDGAGDTGEFSLANESLNGLEFTPGDNRLAFEDIDADGDPDLFVGGNDGRLRFFRNDGGPSDPSFSLTTAFFDSIDVGNVSSAAFGDLN
ncbi:MAG: VCBS repeat-containing protein, partial [Rhodothermales bacterium]